jgi:hypothetical protein
MRCFLLSMGLAVAAVGSSAAGTAYAIPKFSGAWEGPGFDLAPVRGAPGPVVNTSTDIRQPEGNYTNPILQPWAAAAVKQWAEEQSAGHAPLHPHALCLPTSVPGAMTLHGAYEFLQTPKEVTILIANQAQARHIYLDVAHSEHVTPSWYGESVGHYDGDTLVVDTIGIKAGAFTPIDRFGTPHTGKLHIVERIHMTGPKELRIAYHIQDEGAFTKPWDAVLLFHPYRAGWDEEVCDERIDPFTGKPVAHMPIAARPDF